MSAAREDSPRGFSTPLGRPRLAAPRATVGVKPEPKANFTNIPSGFNYHFPRGGACADGQPLGTNGCTWRMLPLARMLYGEDLINAGWDRKFVPDTPTNVSHTLANVGAFSRAAAALDRLVLPVQCGGGP